METIKKQFAKLNNGEWDERLEKLYGSNSIEREKSRYLRAFERYAKIYGWDRKVQIFSIPTCIHIGNEGERNIFVATTGDMLAITADNGTNIFRMQSRGFFGEENIDYFHPGPYEEEKGKVSAILRGMITAFKKFGYNTYGVDTYIDTDIFSESGLCSYEAILATVGTVFNFVFNDGKIPSTHLTQMAKWVDENYFFSKLPTEALLASIAGGITACVDTDANEKYKQMQNATQFVICKISGEQADCDKLYSTENSEKIIADLHKELMQYCDTVMDTIELNELPDPEKANMINKPVGGASIWRMKPNPNNYTYTKLLFVDDSNIQKLEKNTQISNCNFTVIASRNIGAIELTEANI